jgi:hypothetical protein
MSLQLEAITSWLVTGGDLVEVARSIGASDAKAADKLVRAGLARLRRQFAQETETP